MGESIREAQVLELINQNELLMGGPIKHNILKKIDKKQTTHI